MHYNSMQKLFERIQEKPTCFVMYFEFLCSQLKGHSHLINKLTIKVEFGLIFEQSI